MSTAVIDIEQAFGAVCIAVPTPFPVGAANVYLLKSDPPVLIDAGIRTDEAYEVMSGALRDHGYAIADLGAILITHGHRDHMGLLGRLQRESGAEAYAHPDVARLARTDAEQASERRASYVGIMQEFGVPEEIRGEVNALYEKFTAFSEPFALHHHFADATTSHGFTTYFVPGHSPTDTLLVDHARGFTLVGDHILQGTNPNPLLRRPVGNQPRAKALVEYRASLCRSRGLNLGVCLPGHGTPFDDHVAVVDGILAQQDKRTRQVIELVNQGEETPYRVSKRLFPKLPDRNIHLGLSIAVGHLELLEEDGYVVSAHDDDGVLRFRKT